MAAARIKLGLQEKLLLGNLDAVRDWGFSGDYVRAMHMMLNQDEPSDFVIGTERMHTVRDAARIAFKAVGLNWYDYVVVDPALVRTAEVEVLCADATRAHQILGWHPTVGFEELMAMMVESDLAQAAREMKDGDRIMAINW
jgi:GDPmannose 4,6-dehydratase